MRRAIISDQVSMDFGEALHRIHNDFEYVEIHSLWGKTVEDLDDDEAREVETLLRRYGVGVSCLSTTLFLMCPLFTDVSRLRSFSDTFAVFTGNLRAHTERLRRCIELSDRFGTELIRIFPFRTEEGVDVDFSTCISDMGERLSEGVMLAGKGGKLLCLENCPHTYLPRGNMTFELVKSMKSGSLMLLYDPGNSYRAPASQVPESFRQHTVREEYGVIRELIGYFHFKDYTKTQDGFQHVALGKGDVGYRDLYALIRADNVDKTISLEPEVKNEDLDESIRYFLSLGA